MVVPSLVRRALVAGVFVALAAGGSACARRVPPPQAPPSLFGFSTEEQRILACLDLQDHIVDLFADEYVSREGVRLTQHQRAAFRDGWAEQLAKGGTFEPFERSCFGNLTPRRFDCGMSSRTTDGVEACMRISHEPYGPQRLRRAPAARAGGESDRAGGAGGGKRRGS
jgi:hypothetical protein